MDKQLFKKLVVWCEGCESDYAAPGDAYNFCMACRKRWDETERRNDEPNPFYRGR